jgi:2-methylaconitate cis-trans-isomerase PrpF
VWVTWHVQLGSVVRFLLRGGVVKLSFVAFGDLPAEASEGEEFVEALLGVGDLFF